MKILDSREVPKDPVFQFHIELSASEIRALRREIRNYAVPHHTQAVVMTLLQSTREI